MIAAFGAVFYLSLDGDAVEPAAQRIMLLPGAAHGEVVWGAAPGVVDLSRQIDGWRGMLVGIPLDPDRATAKDWDALPGVGEASAAQIVNTRGRLGGFSTPQDLLEVKGIGPKKLEAMEPWIAFAEPGGRR